MTGLLGPLVGAGASIAGGIVGNVQANKAGKAGKKAAKQQIKLGKAQLADVQPQYTADMARQQAVLEAQNRAATQAQATQNRLLLEGRNREAAQLAEAQAQSGAGFAPYTTLGEQSIAARQGLYGESPEAAQGFIDRFHTSPIYALNYQSMLDEANRALSNSRAAAGGLNAGATLRGLSENAGTTSNRLLGDYLTQIQSGIQTGLTAAQAAELARENILGKQLQSSQYYTTGGGQAAQNYAEAVRMNQGAYGQQTAQLGQNRLLNLGQARGAIGQGYANKAAAAGAQAAGVTQAWGNAGQGVAQAFGSSPYGNSMTYGRNPYQQQPISYGGGPTNIVPFNPSYY